MTMIYAMLGVACIVALYCYSRTLLQRKRLLAALPKNKYRIVEYKETNEYLLYTCLDTGHWKYVHEYKTYQLALSGALHHHHAILEIKKSPKNKKRKKVVHSV